MPLPNFLIIGDAKSGTTSLYAYLRQHPDVFMPREKELRYFAFDDDNPYHVRSRSFPVRTHAEYLRHFEDCDNERAIGEASPNYLRAPGAAEKIKAVLPAAKLIVVLRNHPERLYSAYLMDFREGRTSKQFDEAMFGSNAALIKARFYAPDLAEYFARFPAEQIKVILFDDLQANTPEVVRDLYRFLGVDDSFSPNFARENEGGVARSRVSYLALDKARKWLRRAGLTPAALKPFAKRLERSLLTKSRIDPHIRRKILEVCAADIRATQALIGRDLSSWLPAESVDGHGSRDAERRQRMQTPAQTVAFAGAEPPGATVSHR
jgi:hypothetical protein